VVGAVIACCAGGLVLSERAEASRGPAPTEAAGIRRAVVSYAYSRQIENAKKTTVSHVRISFVTAPLLTGARLYFARARILVPGLTTEARGSGHGAARRVGVRLARQSRASEQPRRTDLGGLQRKLGVRRRRPERPAHWRFWLPSAGCPRQESNLRTRFRKPLLYPLSYGGVFGFLKPFRSHSSLPLCPS
jgi:hypothetical protein